MGRLAPRRPNRSMRHHLAALAAAVVLALPASAQLIAVRFKDAKAAKRYEEHLIVFQGQQVVVGEAWSNLDVDASKGDVQYHDKTNHYFEILRPDPKDPGKVPFKIDGDSRKVTNGKCKVGISTDDVVGFTFYSREGSLVGLAKDFADRKGSVDEFLAARDAKAKGGPEWMAQHQRMLQQMERLLAWLQSGLFPDVVGKYEKEIARERKVVAAEAVTARREAAKASAKAVELPEELTRVAASIDPADKFAMQESRHCRIIYRDAIDPARVHELLVMAEEMIDGFRVDFVDPYLDETYEDYIQEECFAEWFFAPDDIPKSERYMTTYYKMGFDPKRKEEILADAGHGTRRSFNPSYVYFWRTNDTSDLEGIVAHNLGHMLASVHYDRRKIGMGQDWLEEGVGLYLSLEWLGRNSVNCKGFAEPGRYVHKNDKKGGERTFQMGLRDWYNSVALESGAPIDKLALKTLYEMNDGDLAKSWSMFDWIAKKTGKEGQSFLRAGCATAKLGKTKFIAEWRAKAEEILGITGKDVFDVVDARWKEFAQVGQDTGDTSKK
jgi:hypothetical protein